jgi:hypothetical protein
MKHVDEKYMRLVTATLVKRTTEDGYFSINDNIELGKEYRVNLFSRRLLNFENLERGFKGKKEFIYGVDVKEWMPTELLNIPEYKEEEE